MNPRDEWIERMTEQMRGEQAIAEAHLLSTADDDFSVHWDMARRLLPKVYEVGTLRKMSAHHDCMIGPFMKWHGPSGRAAMWGIGDERTSGEGMRLVVVASRAAQSVPLSDDHRVERLLRMAADFLDRNMSQRQWKRAEP